MMTMTVTVLMTHTHMYACRPDYKKLGVLKQQFPDVPIMALTATATQRVCDDLKAMLRIEACEAFSASVNRPNLIYEVCHHL
jgi:ATP-dependent DNA helicase Q1